MFIRFVVGDIHEDSQRETGVFQAVYRLIEQRQLPDHEQARLEALLDWFRKHLDAPLRFNRSRRPGRRNKAISWFKPTALEHIRNMREIVGILEDHGIQVRTIKIARPGYVVYEDEYQVAAEPFSDLPS
jgi:hypothetical protein